MVHSSERRLAPYATRAGEAGDRIHSEPPDPLRTPFELDRRRIIESTAFRRLEGKTQVFAPSHHDHFRTRLTHTLEVAQVARCLAAALNANEPLAEAITFAHDLGHPPFGHAGEAALDEAMAGRGGFNHNTHSLRVVEYLEHPFPAFRGLNLTSETRAGLAAHATRYDAPGSTSDHGRTEKSPTAGGVHPIEIEGGSSCGAPDCYSDTVGHNAPAGVPTCASVEAQIASVSDRLAYNCHDLEDAIGAGFVGLGDLKRVALWSNAFKKVAARNEGRSIHALRRVVLDAMLDSLLADVIATSRERLASIPSPEHARSAERPLVSPSPEADSRLAQLERFLVEHVYRHHEVARTDAKGLQIVRALFEAYKTQPDSLPRRFSARIEEQGLERVICDYIAGMTDRFCAAEYDRLTGS